MNPQKIIISAALIAAVVGGITYLNSQKADRSSGSGAVTITPRLSLDRGAENAPSLEVATSSEKKTVPAAPTAVRKPLPSQDKSKKYELAKEITTPDGFINTDGKPVTIDQYIGKKVILVDFWTYSCINCQRTTPYLNAWYEKYENKGFVIIGVHTPEFEFEKVYQNVLEATKRLGIKYPVVLDNDYSTWNAYQNRFWPRKYLIDIDGYIVYDHIGEGGYEETEREIQKLLAERMERLGEKGVVDIAVTEEQPLSRPESPEVYFGASRNVNFGNGDRGRVGVQTLIVPEDLKRNILYLDGAWDIQGEYAENKNVGAAIEFRYKAKEVYFVASSPKGTTAKIYSDGVLIKGNLPAQADGAMECKVKGFCGGADVGANGTVLIKEDRLYKLIQNQDIEEHVLKIEIESPGLKAFTFTFG